VQGTGKDGLHNSRPHLAWTNGGNRDQPRQLLITWTPNPEPSLPA